MPHFDRGTIRKIIREHREAGFVPLVVLEDLIREKPHKIESENGLYVVRLYDSSDRCWMDVSKPCSWEEAVEAWNKETKDGMEHTSYGDMSYYAIYPANTRMIFR